MWLGRSLLRVTVGEEVGWTYAGLSSSGATYAFPSACYISVTTWWLFRQEMLHTRVCSVTFAAESWPDQGLCLKSKFLIITFSTWVFHPFFQILCSIRKVTYRTEEIPPWIKCLFHKREEPSLIPRSYIKLSTSKCASNRCARVVETGGSGGSLASLSSQIGQLWVQRIRWWANNKAQWVKVPASKLNTLSVSLGVTHSRR